MHSPGHEGRDMNPGIDSEYGDKTRPPSTDGNQTHVLIVEDNAFLALDLELVIQGQGHYVAGVAHSCERALRFIDATAIRIDVALVDVDLGGETCVNVVEALKRRGVPYTLVTALDLTDVRRLGLDGPVVQKPYRSPAIAGAIASAAAYASRPSD